MNTDVIEGNKIIIESPFASDVHKVWLKEVKKAGDDFYKTNLLPKLKYHSDWNWLMPVVEKINSLKIYDAIIWRNDCHINDETEILIETSRRAGEELVHVVFRAVVEFITWYNKTIKE